jgi:hypothetical protein
MSFNVCPSARTSWPQAQGSGHLFCCRAVKNGLEGSGVTLDLLNSSALESALAEAPAGPVLLYVHGLATDFLESLEQGLRLQQKYSQPVLVFSWPSGTSPLEYGSALKNLPYSTGPLCEVLLLIQRRVSSYLAPCFLPWCFCHGVFAVA